MRAPLHLAYGILVPEQAVLTLATEAIWCSTELQHATVPYLHGFIEPGTRKDQRTVFIPIQRELLARRRGYREYGGGQWRCERIRSGCKRRGAQVEETDGAVARACCYQVWLMGREECLVYTCVVRLQGRERTRMLWSPLRK
jgi:hypothetical protein